MPRRSVNRWLLLVVIVATPAGLFLFRTQLAEATGRGIAEIGARVIEHQYDVKLYFDHAQMRYATLELEGVGFKLRRYPSLEGLAETVRIDFLTRVVELSDGRMPVGPQTLSFDGWFALRRSAGELSLGLPPTPCQEVLGASPSFVTERLNGLTLRGSLSIDAEVTIDEMQPDNTALLVDLDEGCDVEEFGDVAPPERFRSPFLHRAYAEDGQPLHFLAGPGTPNWVDLDDISPFLIDSVVQAEDPLFWQHNGILLPRIKTAIEENLKHGEPKFGASTITMQLAKNLFLGREKTASRKTLELFFTWYLERFHTKTQILELYLNVVEFGPSLYGVGAAAPHYFGRDPSELNLAEALYLAKLLPSPVRRSRDYVTGRPSASMGRRTSWLARSLLRNGKITKKEYQDALAERPSFQRPGQERPPRRPPMATNRHSGSGPEHVRRDGSPKLSGPRAPSDMLLRARAALVEVRVEPDPKAPQGVAKPTNN
jgi:hypothetical protein